VALLFAGSDTDSVGIPSAMCFPPSPARAMLRRTIVGSSSRPTSATPQVIGCTLPALKAVTTVPQVKAVAESIQQASAVRDLHASQLLANPAIKAVAVGESYDHPGKSAILLFVAAANACGIFQNHRRCAHRD